MPKQAGKKGEDPEETPGGLKDVKHRTKRTRSQYGAGVMSMTVPTHCNLDLPNVPALLEAGLQLEVPQQWKSASEIPGLWGFELRL